MAESSLLSNPVAEDFNVLCGLVFGLLPRGKAAVMHQFGIQGTPVAFHRGVIPAIALATH